MLAWTQQNTMQRAMRTVLEWPQSHAISKTINMLTNKSEPQQKCRLGTVSKILLGGLNRFYRRLTSPSASIMAQNIQFFGPRGGFLTNPPSLLLIFKNKCSDSFCMFAQSHYGKNQSYGRVHISSGQKFLESPKILHNLHCPCFLRQISFKSK